jgi:NADPH-dependent 2,4-dienoyl-CoA reductase/sulfur reductase-like enzyme/rhodanese-related sulfurtransferase
MSLKLIIVGGVAGGASCAARARRISEETEIILLEKGPYISFANCGLPYHIGGVISDREKLLVQTPEAFRRRFRVDVRVEHEVVSIDRAAREVVVRKCGGGECYREGYGRLVLSPGAEPIRPPIPGIDFPGIFTLRDIPDMDAILRRLAQSPVREAVVIGGGFIGLEMVENLAERGIRVTLVEKLPQVMPALDPEIAAYIHKELLDHGAVLRLADGVTEFNRENERLRVRLESGNTVECDMAVLSIGVRPQTRLGREAGLALGTRGGFLVNEHMQTSDPLIYAIGDAAETRHIVSDQPVLIALAGPANRQGRLVADHLHGSPAAYRGSQGTAICKVFDLAVGGTGLSAAACVREGIAHHCVHVNPSHHSGYYPGAVPVIIKLVYAPSDGRLLGAQVVGMEGVDKRIDVLATALRARMTVFDLEHLELAYAPPYGSARDPVNVAGFVAANALRGDAPIAHWDEADTLDPARQAILDVRNPDERDAEAIEGSVHIPLDELRERLSILPRDREWLVHCAGGLRSYLAVRILLQNGYTARNLSGGMQLRAMRRYLSSPS